PRGEKIPNSWCREIILPFVAFSCGLAPNNWCPTARVLHAGLGLSRLGETVGNAEILVRETIAQPFAPWDIPLGVRFIMDHHGRDWSGACGVLEKRVVACHRGDGVDQVSLIAAEAADEFSPTIVAHSEH